MTSEQYVAYACTISGDTGERKVQSPRVEKVEPGPRKRARKKRPVRKLTGGPSGNSHQRRKIRRLKKVRKVRS